MALRVAIQMDPVESIDPEADTTYALALEARRRGHELFHYLPRHLTLASERVTARARPLRVAREGPDAPARLGDERRLDLGAVDVVLMRQDPPFDMAYITATYLLERLGPETLVVNDPAAVRNAPEKLLDPRFATLAPPTVITADRDEILAFRSEHRDIVVKPLYGNGGADVFHVGPDDENLGALLDLFAALRDEPVIVQRYLPRVRHGDKRILLIDGEPAGAVLRVPARGEARSNLHVGGRAVRAGLDARDRNICAAIGPTLREQGLLLAGIDVIGGFLTEINVTSPTGLQEVDRLDGVCLEARVWDAITERLRARAAA